MLYFSPSRLYRKNNFRGSYPITIQERAGCQCRLYREYYLVFGGGALTTDLHSVYLTDSLKFRKFIGTYDDHQPIFSFKCKKDSIYIENANEYRDLKQKSFSLKQLQKDGVFD